MGKTRRISDEMKEMFLDEEEGAWRRKMPLGRDGCPPGRMKKDGRCVPFAYDGSDLEGKDKPLMITVGDTVRPREDTEIDLEGYSGHISSRDAHELSLLRNDKEYDVESIDDDGNPYSNTVNLGFYGDRHEKPPSAFIKAQK